MVCYWTRELVQRLLESTPGIIWYHRHLKVSPRSPQYHSSISNGPEIIRSASQHLFFTLNCWVSCELWGGGVQKEPLNTIWEYQPLLKTLSNKNEREEKNNAKVQEMKKEKCDREKWEGKNGNVGRNGKIWFLSRLRTNN